MKKYQNLIEQKPVYWNYQLYAYKTTLINYLASLGEELGQWIGDEVKVQKVKEHIQDHPVMKQEIDSNLPENPLVETYFNEGCRAARDDFWNYLKESIPEKIHQLEPLIADPCQG